MSVVAFNIERIIKEKGLLKKGVAERAGFTSQELSDMLNNRKIIRADMVPSFCAALGVEPNELFKSNPA